MTAELPVARAPVASVPNLRDLGGIRTTGGRRIAPGVLWRSGHPRHLAPQDVQAIRQIGIRTVVDLRGSREREVSPSPLAGPPGADAAAIREIHLPIEPRAMGALRELRASATIDEQALSAIMFEVYRRFVHQHSSVFAAFLRVLADESTPLPLLFHCTAGKDRTGWAAALTLLALGASHDAVIADFMQSNGRWRKPGESTDWAQLASVRTDYLNCAFEEIEKGWGSVDIYFADALGLDDAARGRMRARLTMIP